jgi:hypothetical protein
VWFSAFVFCTDAVHDSVRDLATSVFPLKLGVQCIGYLAIVFGVFLVPSLAFALAGAFWSARYRVRITIAIEPRAAAGGERSPSAHAVLPDRLAGEAQRAPAS